MERKPKIYILDDEPQILEAITHLVKPIEAEVETYCRVDDFLAGFQNDGPACLVLDVRLPGMSGMELQKHLTQEGYGIPVIIVTGHADVRMAVDAVKAGAAGFLEKPFRPQELFEEIQKTLRADVERWERLDEEQSIDRKLSLLKVGERKVVDLIRQGKNNYEIAEALDLSLRGVEARRAKVMRTLRVDSKTELLRLLRMPGPHNASQPSS